MGSINIIGLGPGCEADMTVGAINALSKSDVIVGYKQYIGSLNQLRSEGVIKDDAEIIQSGMRQERERAEKAIERALAGKNVAVVSSGDAGIYGMAPLILEMLKEKNLEIDVTVIPGISAFQKAASLLGAPMGHDFCVISLSDLMTPWEVIEKRIEAAAAADFVTAVYNPRSVGRYWQLHRLKEIFLKHRESTTCVGFVRNAGREGEKVSVTTLEKFNPEEIDMFTVVIIGNSQSFFRDNKFITPRGYYQDKKQVESNGIGQDIMIESFRTIESELKDKTLTTAQKWPLLHAIHTTADFDMENILKIDERAVARMYEAIETGRTKTIVTDVTMVASGIRKGALARLGLEVKCYLNDDDVIKEAKEKGQTRAQTGIRKAVKEHPEAIFAFGNAPTALLELCDLTRHGKAMPSGIIAAPVGFVHVRESKHAAKTLTTVPKIIVDGRKGGSNIAATLVNSVLCWPDAEQLKPGRDV